MNIDDVRFLFEVIDVKAQTKSNEHPDDGSLRRFKDKWLFIVTLIVILFVLVSGIAFIIFRPESPYINIILNGGFGLVMALCGYYVRGNKI